MKIGILTFHRAHNYGALLQTFALKTHLSALGHQTEIIDYWPEYHDQVYKYIPYFKSRSFLKKIKSILFFIIGYLRILKRSNGFKKFIREKFSLPDNPKYVTEKSMEDIEYDVVIYGSDQIWRRSDYPNFKGFSDVYFGIYPTKVKHKITYAASMGIIDVNEQDKHYVKKMMQNFNAISVREEGLRQLIEGIIEHPVSLVIDPVFLLDREEWIKLYTFPTTSKKMKYILFYQLIPSKDATEFTNRLQSYYGYKVIEIRNRVEPMLFGIRYLQTASPVDFISLIENAEIVVSTSFHGMAFALIFEKQFYSLGMQGNSGRAQTLLNNLDISDRYLTNINQVNLQERIDYIKVNMKLTAMKQQSKSFLRISL